MMTLAEFRLEMQMNLEEFAQDYHKQRERGKVLTMIRPENEWYELFNEFMEKYSGADVAR